MESNGGTSWVRPKSVPFPAVWRKCTGKRKEENGKIPKFRIQDATEDMHEELVGMMATHFTRDEHLCASQNVAADPVSMKEFCDVLRKYLKQNMALVILVEEETESRPRIAGVNFTGVTLKSDKFTYDMYKGTPIRNVMKFILGYALVSVDVFEHYGVDEYMSAMGLLVLPEYRGQGLSTEILKARFDLGRAVGLKATMTFFSPEAAQIAAQNAGFELLAEVFYDDYVEDDKVVFPNIKSKSFKVMGSVI